MQMTLVFILQSMFVQSHTFFPTFYRCRDFGLGKYAWVKTKVATTGYHICVVFDA
jgi:hypothetical protein